MLRIAISAFRRDDARKLLDAGVEELRRRRLVEIADAQHFPRVPTSLTRDGH
jgi:hypothetical protein